MMKKWVEIRFKVTLRFLLQKVTSGKGKGFLSGKAKQNLMASRGGFEGARVE